MGCGPSHDSAARGIEPPTNTKPSTKASTEPVSLRASSLEKQPLLPQIEKKISKKTLSQGPQAPNPKHTAFEIPLDDLILPHHFDSQSQSHNLGPKGLPKLSMSLADMQSKLANATQIWETMDQAALKKTRNKKQKPRLQRNDFKEREIDPEALRKKLEQRELAVQVNREREVRKVQGRLAKHEQHAKRVLERKREMEGGGEEDGVRLRLSVGGEGQGGLLAEIHHPTTDEDPNALEKENGTEQSSLVDIIASTRVSSNKTALGNFKGVIRETSSISNSTVAGTDNTNLLGMAPIISIKRKS